MNQTISSNELKELIDMQGDFVLIEALPPNFYATGHLPGALSFPPGQVAELAKKHLPDKTRKIVVYCSSSICQNSMLAMEELESLGYKNVLRYQGGKEEWKQAGLPLLKP